MSTNRIYKLIDVNESMVDIDNNALAEIIEYGNIPFRKVIFNHFMRNIIPKIHLTSQSSDQKNPLPYHHSNHHHKIIRNITILLHLFAISMLDDFAGP